MLVGLIVLLQTSLLAVEEFKNTYEALIDPTTTETVPYVNFEATIAEKFNNFFFGASSSCSGEYDSFRHFVEMSYSPL